jgi:hypothetical protein
MSRCPPKSQNCRTDELSVIRPTDAESRETASHDQMSALVTPRYDAPTLTVLSYCGGYLVGRDSRAVGERALDLFEEGLPSRGKSQKSGRSVLLTP